ncbi:hypothetical protein NQ918_002417 [Escherichia coli]|nr:hypothetical protein [Escherichia coli]
MSQQHTTQASGQGMLERVFKLREHGTTARTEVIAGFTTFLTMVYIVFVNPQILGVAGMDTSAVFVTTCLIAAFGSIMMGLFANLPVALAPAMGLNAFFAFVVVQAMGLPWQVGMGAIFWGAIGLLLLTIFRVRYWMIANIPVSLRVGITSGIGLFSFSITEGIALGFISYCVMKIGTGRLRDLSPCVIIVALLFILKIVFIDAH